MNTPAAVPPIESPVVMTTGEHRALADRARAYAERHQAMEHYILNWHLLFGWLRRRGLQPTSWQGRALGGGFVVVLLMGAATAATALSGEWDVAPWGIWLGVSLAFALLGAFLYQPMRRAIGTFLALHEAIREPASLDRLIVFDRNWFTVRRSVPTAGAFATVMLASLLVLLDQMPGRAVPTGTLVVGAMLLYQLGEILYSVILLGLESPILATCHYQLFRLNPMDSVPIRKSLRGSNAMALLVGLVATAFILGFVALFAARTDLVVWIGLGLLLLSYVATGFGVVLPRLAILKVIRDEKEREMAPLQRRLDELAAQAVDLTEAEHEQLERLKAVHDMIRDSSENILPVTSAGQLLSAVVLPTVTFVATTVGRDFVVRLFGG